MKKAIGLFLLAAGIMPLTAQNRSTVTVSNLKTEYRENPLGVDNPQPRFSWQLNSEQNNVLQTAYEVTVSTDSMALVRQSGAQWSSGKVPSARVNGHHYAGATLDPQTRYYWRVKVWNNKDAESSVSPVASFETSMFRMADWRGQWIDAIANPRDQHAKPDEPASPYFRKEASVTKSIKSARAYITGLGYYLFYINGTKVGNEWLAPTFTDFSKRVYYQTFDIAPYLRQGDNAFGVVLGNGWFNMQSTAVWEFDKAPWRDTPKFIANIRIDYTDGTSQWIVSDPSWRCTTNGPIRFNSLYSGEYYDARKEMPGWNLPGFDDKGWKQATPSYVKFARIPSAGQLHAQNMQPITLQEQFKAVSMKKLSDRIYLFDFGVNMAGLSKITLQGAAGTELKLRHGERIAADGRIDLKKIGEHARFSFPGEEIQTDRYTLKGGATEEFMPVFTYHGFQYVEVEASAPIELNQNSVVAWSMNTNVAHTGTFECSNPLLNDILRIGQRSYLSNLHGIFTDCPHREKNGWTGDAQLACEVGLYNYDALRAYEKYVIDLCDAQQGDGQLPGIVPSAGWGYHWGNGPAWDAALILIPYYCYLYTGDEYLLRYVYPYAKRYMDYLSFTANDYILGIGLGDWCPFKTKTPVELTSSLYFHVFAQCMELFARLQNEKADEAHFAALASNIARSVNAKFLHPETGVYANGSQTAQSAALYEGVVSAQLQSKVADRMVEAVAAANNHLDFGILGSKYLLNALTETGHNNVAYTLASQSTYPSWGFWIKDKGATSMHEAWDSSTSLSHIMFGEIAAWFYKALGGINPSIDAPGFSRAVIRPGVDTELTSAKSTVVTPYGPVVCDWSKGKKNKLSVTLSVPAGATATLELPSIYQSLKINGQEQRATPSGRFATFALGSGTYTIATP